jgi:hypothetical protein
MITVLYIAAGVIAAVGSIFFAWRNREFRKFLAGAFFVSSGVLFYLFLADVSVPLLGELGRRKSPLLHRRPPCLKLLLQGLGVRIPKSVILFERAVLGEHGVSKLRIRVHDESSPVSSL